MEVHFVCKGNLYRGRLAQAYLQSKQVPGITVTSSGTEANKHKGVIGPISWEAMRLIKNYDLVPFMKHFSEETIEQMLSQANLVIFFEKEIYEAVKLRFPVLKMNYQLWEIPDIILPDYTPSIKDNVRRLEISERTFIVIKQKVDELVVQLSN